MMIMNILKTLGADRFLLLRRLVVGTLAGLLIVYHCTVLYDLYLGVGNHAGLYDRAVAGTPRYYEYIQSVLRLFIVIGLSLVVSGWGRALWLMWAAIGALVATHYWAHFGGIPVAFTAGRHPLSYLKGFIFPTVITLLTRLPPRRINTR
ncbi:MAG TPA: hypothetical protein PKI03_00135 [Pseudomonadota bacterium]|nr:hypothetical protein [Pseudomonadota bacterium]